MSESTDRANELAKLTPNEKALKKKLLTLQRTQQARQIVNGVASEKRQEEVVGILTSAVEGAQKKIDFENRKLSTEISLLNSHLEKEKKALLEAKENKLKNLQTEVDKFLRDIEAKKAKIEEDHKVAMTKKETEYQIRIDKKNEKLKANEEKPTVKIAQTTLENYKNKTAKLTLSEVKDDLHIQDLNDAIGIVPVVRQNEIVQTQKKENDKLRLEQMGAWCCWGCQKAGRQFLIGDELPALEEYGFKYCKSCAESMN